MSIMRGNLLVCPLHYMCKGASAHNIAAIGNSIQSYQRPVISYRAVGNQIFDLDASILPGLPEAQFKKLFAKCYCGLITTKRVFNIHRCIRAEEQTIIDLTGSDSDELDN
jgi:hypothetical protein